MLMNFQEVKWTEIEGTGRQPDLKVAASSPSNAHVN